MLYVGEIIYENEIYNMNIDGYAIKLHNNDKKIEIPFFSSGYLLSSLKVKIDYNKNSCMTIYNNSTEKNRVIFDRIWHNSIRKLMFTNFFTWKKLNDSYVVSASDNGAIVIVKKEVQCERDLLIKIKKSVANFRVLFYEEREWMVLKEKTLKFPCRVTLLLDGRVVITFECQFEQYSMIVPFVYKAQKAFREDCKVKNSALIDSERQKVKFKIINLFVYWCDYPYEFEMLVRDNSILLVRNGDKIKRWSLSGFEMSCSSFRLYDGRLDKENKRVIIDGNSEMTFIISNSDIDKLRKHFDDYRGFVNRKSNENKQHKQPLISIRETDSMNGEQFEHFVSRLLKKLGYNTSITRRSGDQGIDIIATKSEMRIGIQAKRYSGKVSNKAIQEVVAGLALYNLDLGMVITNSYFTNSAIELAEANQVQLWNRSELSRKIQEAFFEGE